MDELPNNFDANNGITTSNGLHKVKSQEIDMHKVVKQLLDIQAYNPNIKKINKSFKHMSTNLIRTLDEATMKEWMVDHVAQLMN